MARRPINRERVVFRGVVYTRYPDAKDRAHRVYFNPAGGGRNRTGLGALHREIWKSIYGEIPLGYDVHHADGDPLNNDPTNLECITKREHAQRHNDGKHTERRRTWINQIRPLASAWHRSEAAREFHRRIGRESWKNRKPIDRRPCASCGMEFDAYLARARYCSRTCINRMRETLYKVERACALCGAPFLADKYRKDARARKYCGRLCARRARMR